MESELAEEILGQEALHKNEERLRLALKAGRMGIWEGNFAANDVRGSPELEAIHGLASWHV